MSMKGKGTSLLILGGVFAAGWYGLSRLKAKMAGAFAGLGNDLLVGMPPPGGVVGPAAWQAAPVPQQSTGPGPISGGLPSGITAGDLPGWAQPSAPPPPTKQQTFASKTKATEVINKILVGRKSFPGKAANTGGPIGGYNTKASAEASQMWDGNARQSTAASKLRTAAVMPSAPAKFPIAAIAAEREVRGLIQYANRDIAVVNRQIGELMAAESAFKSAKNLHPALALKKQGTRDALANDVSRGSNLLSGRGASIEKGRLELAGYLRNAPKNPNQDQVRLIQQTIAAAVAVRRRLSVVGSAARVQASTVSPSAKRTAAVPNKTNPSASADQLAQVFGAKR